MSTCAVVRSLIESKTTEVQTSNVGFTSKVSDYLVVHTGPDVCFIEASKAGLSKGLKVVSFVQVSRTKRCSRKHL